MMFNAIFFNMLLCNDSYCEQIKQNLIINHIVHGPRFYMVKQPQRLQVKSRDKPKRLSSQPVVPN